MTTLESTAAATRGAWALRALLVLAATLVCACGKGREELALVDARAEIEADGERGFVLRVGAVLANMRGRMDDGEFVLDTSVALHVTGPDGRSFAPLSREDAADFSTPRAPISSSDFYSRAPFEISLSVPRAAPAGEYTLAIVAQDRFAGARAEKTLTVAIPAQETAKPPAPNTATPTGAERPPASSGTR